MTEEKSLKEQYIESQKNAFFREVQEEVNTDKAIKFWNTYKKPIIGIIVVILGFTVAKNWYANYKQQKSLKEAIKFEKILSSQNITTEGRILELQKFAQEAKFGYKDVAYFNLYSLQIENKKTEDAIKTLEIIINDATDTTFKNIAILKLTSLISSSNEKDLKKAIKYLDSIGKSKPFYSTAQLVLATIYIKQNEYSKAFSILDDLTNNMNIPTSIRAKGLTLLNFVKAKMKK